MKRILVTGAGGFIGKNLMEALRRRPGLVVRGCHRGTPADELERGLGEADIVYHLAGVNRPKHESEYQAGNTEFTRELCDRLNTLDRRPRIVFSSSIQAAVDNPYGISKRRAEETLRAFAAETGAAVSIYRLQNVFGKWSAPNYNSVVATFCHNLTHNLPIHVSDADRPLKLVYIDDVVTAFLGELDCERPGTSFKQVDNSRETTLGALAGMIRSFQESRRTLLMPDLSDPLAKQLYATFLSFLSEHDAAYGLRKNVDARGELAEFIKSTQFGQIFVSRTKPGVTRGNHYHDTKTEKFLVLEGDAVVRLRHVDRDEIAEYRVSGREFRVVDIPPGYTHSIENVGRGEMIVVFWASEVFQPNRADTYPRDVSPVTEKPHEGRFNHRHAA